MKNVIIVLLVKLVCWYIKRANEIHFGSVASKPRMIFKVLLPREFLSIAFKTFKISLLIINILVFWKETIIWGIFRFVSFSVKIKIIGGNKSCLFLKGLECCFLLELCLLSVQAIENTEIKSCDNTAYVILTKASLHFL